MGPSVIPEPMSWFGLLASLVLGAFLLWGGWKLTRLSEPTGLPGKLGWLLVGAALLHLVVALFWYAALPAWGHASAPEQAGYVFADAHQRDQSAWELAKSQQPLWTAFRDNRAADQYGGLLFLSGLIYRYTGGTVHQPLQIAFLAAVISVLAVLFTWVLSRRIWDERVAWAAAWIMLIYPEFILLGSSQMREAFTIPLAAACFYGLARYTQDRSWVSLAWVGIPFLLILPFSPLTAVYVLLSLLLVAVVAGIWRGPKRQRPTLIAWLVLGVLLILAVAATWYALQQFAPQGMTNPISMLEYWLRKSTAFQAYLSENASGWLQKVFDSIPGWLRLPVLLGYGVVQPFLPAALIASSAAPIWTGIAIWRALGWTILLVLLIYATLRAKDQKGLGRGLLLVVWIGILIASFRGGGDMWDNPRYRTFLAGVQAGLAGWAWVQARRTHDPWLRRLSLALTALLLWFVPWYMRRYLPVEWPIVDVFMTIGLGVASAVLVIVWDWARMARASKRRPELSSAASMPAEESDIISGEQQ